jgi:hypothetical protein
MNTRMRVTVGSTDRAVGAMDTSAALAAQALSARRGLLAFSALPDAPVMPVNRRGRRPLRRAWRQ